MKQIGKSTGRSRTFDIYKGGQMLKAIRVWLFPSPRAQNRTLTDVEVNEIVKNKDELSKNTMHL